ncbi:hypothetical protein HG530_010540 [Fusarium avenaceum]|nr:hypothetical protein HG530_010540 [Fusarium avenaceum]
MSSDKRDKTDFPVQDPDSKMGKTLSLQGSMQVGEANVDNGNRGRKVLKRIDLCLMPLLLVSYTLQFLDKQSLNFASIMGIIDDLWLFIIFGLITLVWAIVLAIFLPDTPENARFLTEQQRIDAVDRIRVNQTGMKNNNFKWEQVREVIKDPNVLMLMLFQLTFSIPNGAHTTFSSLVMAGFGFNRLQVYLLNMPMGAILAFFALGSTYLCSRYSGYRTIIGACLSLISLTGSLLVRYGPNQGSQLFGLWVFVAFAAGFPISLSMVASNVAGFTKKSVASAMMFMAYTAGNIIGPFLFFPSEAPGYSSGFLATTICFGVSTLTMLVLRLTLIRENKRRDELQQTNASAHDENGHLEISDVTDRKNLNFRYVY